MAHVSMGPGTMHDYYNGGVARTTFMGFPLADRNDFDSGIYAAPAIEVALADLVKWFWRVKKWTVVFDQVTPAPPAPREFDSTYSSEFEIVQNLGAFWMDSATNDFGFGVVINADGAYGLQSELTNNGDPTLAGSFYDLTSTAGDDLTFTDLSDPSNTAVATPSEYWPYAD